MVVCLMRASGVSGGRCVCVPHEGTGVMGVGVCMLRASGVMV